MTLSKALHMARFIKAMQRYIMIASSLFIVTAIGTAAFVRYVLKTDLYGLEEFVSVAAIWLYFMGAVYATHTHTHISAEVFSTYCRNAKARLTVRMLSDIVTCGLAVLYSYWGWEFFYWSITEGGKSNLWQIPLVVSHSAIFIGFVLMALYMLAGLLGEIAELFSRTIRIASQYPKGHPTTAALNTFAQQFNNNSNGRRKIKVYPDNALGDYTQIYDQLSDGSIGMGLITVPSRREQEMEALYLPYLAMSYEEAKAIYATGSPLFDKVDKLHADHGIKFLGFHAEGFGGLGLVKKPDNLRDPKAVKNIELRVPPMDIFKVAAADQGFHPVTIPFAELDMAMRNEAVDGWSGNTAVVGYHQFRDVVKYYLANNNFFEVTSFLMNHTSWERLSAQEQQFIQDAIAEISNDSFDMARANESKCLELMTKEGIEVVTLTEAELAAWADHARQTSWPKAFSPFTGDLLDSIDADVQPEKVKDQRTKSATSITAQSADLSGSAMRRS